MSILHVVSSYWPAFEFGGPIQSVHLLNKSLVGKGARVTVFTTNAGLEKNRNIPLRREVDRDGVRVLYFPYFGYRHFNFSPSLFFYLKNHIREFDLVHITGVWNFPVSAAAFWARRYKKPYIISPRGSLMKEPLGRKSSLRKKIQLFLVGKKDLSGAAAVHFTVEGERKEYLEANLPLKKPVVLPNSFEESGNPTFGKEIDIRAKHGIPAGKKIILSLGRISWKKGFDTLIPAFSEVIKNEPETVLIMAGGDDERYQKEVERLVVREGLAIGKNVFFVGMVTGPEKYSLIEESDVFVLPSYSENFGMSVVESMSHGTAVVVSEGVGIAPDIKFEEAGVVTKKDTHDFAEGILRVLRDSRYASELERRGKDFVRNHYDPGKVAEKFISVYKEIVKTHVT